jgi:hypothetical protein
MGPLIRKVIAASVPFVAMVAVTVAVDPANLFHAGPEETIAAMLVAGKPIAGLIDYDDRLVQKHYISTLGAPKDVVVLGSSRSMQLRAAEFPGRTFFNHSVTGAVLDDFAAIVQEYERRPAMPRHVVLVLDPWLLSARATRPFRPAAPIATKVREAISPSYFQAALRSLKAYGRRPWPREPWPDEPGGMTLADGSRVYPRSIHERDAAHVRADAVRTAAAIDERLQDYRELDRTRVQTLEAIVTALRARGATVEFLLVPYHPITIARYRSSPEHRMVFAAEARYRELAARWRVAIRGDYDPSACGCDESEFLDAGHARESCVAKVLDQQPRPFTSIGPSAESSE